MTERLVAWLRSHNDAPAEIRARTLTRPARFHRSQALISAFYAFLFLLAASQLADWDRYLTATEATLRWPLFWLPSIESRVGVGTVLVLHQLGGLAAIALARYRFARIFICLSLFQHLALRFSFGSIHHGSHLGLLLSFVLIFLPAGWHSFPSASRSVRAATLMVFSGCQALILMVYSMSGFWKLVGVFRQLVAGEVSYLHPWGFAQQVASKQLGADATTTLGPWLIEHAWLGFPLGLAAIYFELTALMVLFRPSLHRIWALALVALHVGSYLLMEIGFVENVIWLVLFLVLSPFRPQRLSWRRLRSELPGVPG